MLFQELKGNIRVFCRVRPAAPGAPAEPPAVSFPADGDLAGRAIQLAAPPVNGRAAEEYSFAFDRVFGPTAGQVCPCVRAQTLHTNYGSVGHPKRGGLT